MADTSVEKDSKESKAEEEIVRLLQQAASEANGLRVPIRWSFGPQSPSFIKAKEVLGAVRLLELLKRLRCQSDLAVDDNGEETYEQCKRLGFVFMPNNKSGYPSDDAPEDYEGDGKNLDISKVRWECETCFEAAIDEHLIEPSSFWFGPEADAFFGLGEPLINTMNTGCPPGSSSCYSFRGGCLQPDRIVWNGRTPSWRAT